MLAWSRGLNILSTEQSNTIIVRSRESYQQSGGLLNAAKARLKMSNTGIVCSNHTEIRCPMCPVYPAGKYDNKRV